MRPVERLARIVVNAADPEALGRFYVDVLGFERVAAPVVSLRLAEVRLDLVRAAGRACPPGIAGWSPLFQHFAIVVTDMTRAMQALRASRRWTPISIAGPERLPANTGGVTAFKFRDPEGHPLELLAVPGAPVASGLFARIDHSAVSVADIGRSIAFYEALGLRVIERSLNVGPEQQRLDDVVDARVDVVGLALPTEAKPHVELLGYRGDHDRTGPTVAVDDIVATRLVFQVADADALEGIVDRHADRVVEAGPAVALLRDPDGHLLQFEMPRQEEPSTDRACPRRQAGRTCPP